MAPKRRNERNSDFPTSWYSYEAIPLQTFSSNHSETISDEDENEVQAPQESVLQAPPSGEQDDATKQMNVHDSDVLESCCHEAQAALSWDILSYDTFDLVSDREQSGGQALQESVQQAASSGQKDHGAKQEARTSPSCPPIHPLNANDVPRRQGKGFHGSSIEANGLINVLPSFLQSNEAKDDEIGIMNGREEDVELSPLQSNESKDEEIRIVNGTEEDVKISPLQSNESKDEEIEIMNGREEDVELSPLQSNKSKDDEIRIVNGTVIMNGREEDVELSPLQSNKSKDDEIRIVNGTEEDVELSPLHSNESKDDEIGTMNGREEDVELSPLQSNKAKDDEIGIVNGTEEDVELSPLQSNEAKDDEIGTINGTEEAPGNELKVENKLAHESSKLTSPSIVAAQIVQLSNNCDAPNEPASYPTQELMAVDTNDLPGNRPESYVSPVLEQEPDITERQERDITERQEPDITERQERDNTERQEPDITERQEPDITERQERDNTERQEPDITERQERDITERQEPDITERQEPDITERQERDNTERQEPDITERQERDNTERQERDNTERQERDNTERQERDNTERQERDNTERQERDNTERQERDNTERQERDNTERQERDNTERAAAEINSRRSSQLAPIVQDSFPKIGHGGVYSYLFARNYLEKHGVLPSKDGKKPKLIVCNCDQKESKKPKVSPLQPNSQISDQQLFQDAVKEGKFKRRYRQVAFPGARIKTWEEDIGSASASEGSSSPSSDGEQDKFNMYTQSRRILLMGLPGSGKSSIRKVVFEQVAPEDIKNLESTGTVVKWDISNSSHLQLQGWDIPWEAHLFDGSYESFLTFRASEGIVFVIDAQTEHKKSLKRLQSLIKTVHKIRATLPFDIFIHKVEAFSDNEQLEMLTDFQNRIITWLKPFDMDKVQISFHLTSIYDFSIFEAFSKVVERSIPQLPALENILNTFVVESGVEKAFFMHPVNKMYFATDSFPVDMQSYRWCCHLIDQQAKRYRSNQSKKEGVSEKQTSLSARVDANTVLYVKEINQHMALLCTSQDGSKEAGDVIEQSFNSLCDALQGVFEQKEQNEPSKQLNKNLEPPESNLKILC